MEMKVVERTDEILRVALSGRLDTNAAEELDESFRRAVAERERPTIVDLSGVDFLSSRGIGLLIGGNKSLRKAGHRLVLLNPQPLVDASLRTAKMERVMPIVYSLDDAVRLASDVGGDESTVGPRVVAAADIPSATEGKLVDPTPGRLKFAIKNELAELKSVIEELTRFLEAHHVPKRAAYAASLAVDEMVVNVMRYAYMDDEVHLIDLDASVADDQIILEIVDDGRPFDPRTGPALDLHAEDRPEGGMGLLLVLEMVDMLKYQRVGNHNRVEIRIHLAREAAGVPASAAENADEASQSG